MVGNLAGKVVADVSLGDSVHEVRADRAEEVSVHGAESTSDEVPFSSIVVRKGRVGVLKVGDHDEPVVDGEVGDTVVLDNFSKTSHFLTEEGEESEHSDEESIRDEDIHAVTSVENEGLGVKVVGPGRVPELSRSIAEKVSGPSEELLNEKPSETVDGSIFEKLVEDDSGSDFDLLRVLLELALRKSTGNEDFVASQVSGSGVVLGVRDTPRVVRYENERVKEESDGVVEGLRGRESLVTTFVTENPNTSHNPTLDSPVQGPRGPLGSESSPSVESITLETKGGIDEGSGVSESGDESEIASDIGERDCG